MLYVLPGPLCQKLPLLQPLLILYLSELLEILELDLLLIDDLSDLGLLLLEQVLPVLLHLLPLLLRSLLRLEESVEFLFLSLHLFEHLVVGARGDLWQRASTIHTSMVLRG